MYDNKCYKILGLPFYNEDTKDEFSDSFERLVL
jgi:hypothetical protein